MYPFLEEKGPPPDVQAVLDTAALLDINEFQVFDLAFRDWHGRRLPEKHLETFFVAYMFDGEVPPWVRQFTRKVARLQEQGHLSREAFGLRGELAPRPRPAAGMYYITWLILALAVLVSLALASDWLPFLKGCYFPPCY